MGFQHLFHKRSTKKQQEKSDVTETYKTLIDSRMDRLESNYQLLRSEWNDTYEKISLLYDRNRKRLKLIEKAGEGEKTPDPVQTPITRDDILTRYRQMNGE